MQQPRYDEQLAALLDVIEATSDVTDLTELARRALERVFPAISAVGGGIWLYDHQKLRSLFQTGLDDQEPHLRLRQPLQADTPLGRVMASGEAEFIATLPSPDHPEGSPQSLAFLPLAAGGDRIGVMIFLSRPGTTFEDHPLMAGIAAHLAVAIRSAQLFHAIERQRRHLDAIERQRDEFLSIVLHDIKNPLASIKGYADLMLRRIARNPTDPNQKGLEIISQQVNRANGLLEQLLDLSRIGMDRLRIERRPTDLVALLQRIVEEMRAITEVHHLALTIDDPALVIRIDEARIHQVIGNLVNNAIKYSPAGGTITITIRQVTNEKGPEVIIAVSDQGIGIPTAEQEYIFRRFFRASNASGTYTGIGLGLYIAREIVVRHAGRIWLESEEGQGTTFYLALPLGPARTQGSEVRGQGSGNEV